MPSGKKLELWKLGGSVCLRTEGYLLLSIRYSNRNIATSHTRHRMRLYTYYCPTYEACINNYPHVTVLSEPSAFRPHKIKKSSSGTLSPWSQKRISSLGLLETYEDDNDNNEPTTPIESVPRQDVGNSSSPETCRAEEGIRKVDERGPSSHPEGPEVVPCGR